MSTKKILNPFSLLQKKLFLIYLFLALFNGVFAQQMPAPVNGKSTFTAKLMNIEAATNEVFRYTATLSNGTTQANVYELKADVPIGWVVSFKVDGNQVTSVNVDAGKSQMVSIEINATATADPNKYKIAVKATVGAETALLPLEAVVKGAYSLALSTPTGRLSDEVTSGSQKEILLQLKNTGTLPLNNVDITSQLPTNWETTFEPSKINQVLPGKTVDIKANVKVPDKTIAGDYAATFTATNANGNSPVAFRFVVKTSLLSGWIGILVILAAVALVYFLIRKYGRR